MKRTKLGLLLAVLVLLGALAPWAWAAETVDPAQRGELIIEYVYDSKPVTGAMFCLYRVADVLEKTIAEGGICVVGGQKQLDECGLDTILTL